MTIQTGCESFDDYREAGRMMDVAQRADLNNYRFMEASEYDLVRLDSVSRRVPDDATDVD